MTNEEKRTKKTLTVEAAVVRVAGDSGDGMQLTGTQFTDTAAALGNDLATFPDFPAEIRAPAGTTFGVSGFQINFAARDIYTPGDHPDVLVAMNPAALKVNLPDLKSGGLLIVNSDAFNEYNVTRAGYQTNPLTDGSLSNYRLLQIDVTTQVERALADTGLSFKEIGRAKNFWTLGLLYYLFNRSLERSLAFIDAKFKGSDQVAEGNRRALKAGFMYGDVSELFHETYEVRAAPLASGLYRNITGNTATALGFIAAAQLAKSELFYGSYPITPASDILHELSKYKNFGVVTFQAEDEIAAICATIGAAYAGKLALTGTSGPGVALKTEAIGLAVTTELPIVIVDVQRGGPSTGLPTKTEQADLFQAMYGRNGEAPCIIVAPATPGDCFGMAIEACRLAVKYMVPVFFLSDGYLANGSEPWRVPDVSSLPEVKIQHTTNPDGFHPFKRDPATLGRVWAIPGTPGLEHRIGGIEKSFDSGHISYDPMNHEKMVHTRADKVARAANDIPELEVFGSPKGGKLLLVGWGSTFGAIRQATELAREKGLDVSHAHLRHLNPFPKNLADVLRRYDRIVVPEMNGGQLAFILRGTFLANAESYSKVQGKPFRVSEILDRIEKVLGESPRQSASERHA